MARTALALTEVTAAGVDPGAVALAAELTDGNAFPWSPHRRLYVVNGDAVELTVTVQTPATVGSGALAVADGVYSVPAGSELLIPPFGPEYRRTDGQVWIDYAGAAAAVTVAVLDEG